MSKNSEKVSSQSVHPAFKKLSSHTIPSLNIELIEFEHQKTGAQHFHFNTNNSENVFMTAFKTVPMDSKGVAHILEHTALCGSKKYPVRDPFFMMIRRSMNTFMNAFTSSDWTAYPFATQNRKDYFNLLSVYLDACFFSRLHPLDFAQEGHRVEFSEPDNPESELVYKGVVFNEMKGAMSPPDRILHHTLNQYLFPESTYHFNSGGEPQDIPKLSYEELLSFYKTHYHPSNAIFFSFGDIPAYELQEQFESTVLNQFERSPTVIAVQPEKRLLSTLRVHEHYGIDPEALPKSDKTNPSTTPHTPEPPKQKTYHVMAWLLGNSTDTKLRLEAQLFNSVLLENSASPLRKALETFEHATAPSRLCGLESDQLEMSFMCGVQGSEIKHVAAFEECVMTVLNDIAANGIEPEVLESICHQIELGQREIGGDSYPYGLQMMLGILPAAIHGGSAIELIDLESALQDLRTNIKDPDYIKRIIKEHLLNNTHKVVLTLSPDMALNEHKQAYEKQVLATMKEKMSADEKQNVISLAAQLKERQNQKDDESILPKVGLSDLPHSVSIPTPCFEKDRFTGFQAGTNGISYCRTVIDMPQLSAEQSQILPFFTTLLTELGSGNSDYLTIQKRQSSISGGISAFTDLRSHMNDTTIHRNFFMLSSKALHRNLAPMKSLLDDTLFKARFDETDRIKELFSQLRAGRENNITGNGHSYAMLAASSCFSSITSLGHQVSGLSGIKKLKLLDDSLKQDTKALDNLIAEFKSIHNLLISAPKRRLLVTDATDWEALSQQLAIDNGQKEQYTPYHFSTDLKVIDQCWTTNTQVNFCAEAFATIPFDHKDSSALSVLASFLRNGYLHRAVREEGGAYGGGAGHDRSNGIFRFYSYRDPRLLETFEDFKQSIQWVIDSKLDAEQLEQAILGLVSDIDKPGSPSGEARQAYQSQLHGRGPDVINALRQSIRDVSLDDLKRVAETYLTGESAKAVVTSTTHANQLKNEAGFQHFEV